MNKKILFSVIDHKAAERKNQVAVSATGRSLTYGELSFFSDHVARQLLASGLKKGEVVGAYIPKSIEYIVTILGINKAGGIFMPLEINYPAERLSKLLEYVQPAFVIVKKEYENNFTPFISSIPQATLLSYSSGIGLDSVLCPAPSPDCIFPEMDGDDSCYLIYTSGSTGTPKIIEGAHKSLSHFIHWEIGEFNLSDSVKTGLVAPLSFDVSLRDIFVPLLAGGTLFIPDISERLDIKQFLEWLNKSRLTLLHIVPSLFRLLTATLEQADSGASSIASLQYILLAGEPLYGKDILQWRQLAGDRAELVNLYGPSETTLAKLFYRIPLSGVVPDSILPLGKPLPNTTIAIINNGRLCSVGDTGEIYIKTPFRSKGYYRDAALTALSFIQNPLHNDFPDIIYRTGDWGKYLPDNLIAFTGRQDAQVKIRGNRVEISEVERIVLSHEGVRGTVVAALETKDHGLSLCCYYTENKKINLLSLQDHIKQRLPDYMLPSYFVRLENFPLNLNGKINRRALPKPEDMLYDELVYIAPANDLEKALAVIWGEMLGLKKVGTTNSFFELGGHSLVATRIVSRITYVLNKELSLKDFFENISIRQLAQYLSAKEEKDPEKISFVERDEDVYDISFEQKRILIAANRFGEKSLYNMPLAFRFTGKLDIVTFKQAFPLLIQRHQSLRTTFHEKEGNMLQQVHTNIGFNITEVNAEGQEEQLITRQLLKELVQEEFDLEKGPLLSAKLIRFNEEKHLLLFNIHHIVCDGWSLGILFKEFVALYNQQASGIPAQLPVLTVQYKDYVYWVKNKIADGRLAASRQFWHSILENIPVFSPITADFPATTDTGNRGKKHNFHFLFQESEQIRMKCLNLGVSLHNYVTAMIYILLFRRCGQKQLTVGVPVAGRIHPAFQHQIGNYMNNLVLSIEIREDESFVHFVQRVKSAALNAYDHQEYPYDLLVEERNVPATGQNPFYNILVVVNNEGLMGEKDDLFWLSGDIKIEAVKIEEEISKLDLSFFIYDKMEIAIAIEYNIELFKRESLTKMESLFRQINHLVINSPDISVSDLLNNISEEQEKELRHKIALHNTEALNESF